MRIKRALSRKNAEKKRFVGEVNFFATAVVVVSWKVFDIFLIFL